MGPKRGRGAATHSTRGAATPSTRSAATRSTRGAATPSTRGAATPSTRSAATRSTRGAATTPLRGAGSRGTRGAGPRGARGAGTRGAGTRGAAKAAGRGAGKAAAAARGAATATVGGRNAATAGGRNASTAAAASAASAVAVTLGGAATAAAKTGASKTALTRGGSASTSVVDPTANDQIGQMPVEVLHRIVLFLVASCANFGEIDQVWASIPKVRRSWRAIFGGSSFWIRALDAMAPDLRTAIMHGSLAFSGSASLTRVPYTAADIAPLARTLKIDDFMPDIGFATALFQFAPLGNLKILRFSCTMKGDPPFDQSRVRRLLEVCRAPIETLVFPSFRIGVREAWQFGLPTPGFFRRDKLAGAVEKHVHLRKVVLRDLPSGEEDLADLMASLGRLPALRTLVVADTSSLSPVRRTLLGAALRTFPALSLLDITYDGTVPGERQEYERLCAALPSRPTFTLRAKGPADEFHDDEVGYLTDTEVPSTGYRSVDNDSSLSGSSDYGEAEWSFDYDSWDEDSHFSDGYA